MVPIEQSPKQADAQASYGNDVANAANHDPADLRALLACANHLQVQQHHADRLIRDSEEENGVRKINQKKQHGV